MNNADVAPLIPEILMALVAMGFLLLGVSQGNRSTGVLCWASCLALVGVASLTMNVDVSSVSVFNGMLVFDQFAGVMKLLVLGGLMAILAMSVNYIYQEGIARFEYPVLIIVAGLGMMLMLSANNMLSLYMALELQSLSLYILAAFHRNSTRSAEAASKYFILGALSSGMLLFGISLIYGFTGSLDFYVIRDTLAAQTMIPPGFTIGMVFVLAAIAFKISAVPFHMWTPDVYQGAPTSVTALFAIVPKVAALGMLARLLFVAFEPASEQWVQILYFLALASMFVGSFAAIAQTSIKRLMAYSSIGNMGYVLVAFIAGGAQGVGAMMVFMLVYIFMTIGVFAIILNMRRGGIAVERIEDLSGLSKHSPIVAYCMAVLMFSMSGIPPLAGFFSKYFVFLAAVDQGHYVLAVLGILTSVVAAFYYLRIIKVMFFGDAGDPFDTTMQLGSRIVLLISILFVTLFIFKPAMFYDPLVASANGLFVQDTNSMTQIVDEFAPDKVDAADEANDAPAAPDDAVAE